MDPSDNERMDLFRNNAPLALFIAKQWFRRIRNPHVPFDDIVQCAFVGLWKATEHYDKSRGPIGVFAGWKIRHEIQDLYFKTGSPVHMPWRSAQYYQHSSGDASMANLQNGGHAEQNSNDEIDAASILASLTPEQRDVMVLKFEHGLNWAEVAEKMRISVWKVRRIAANVIIKIVGLPEQ